MQGKEFPQEGVRVGRRLGVVGDVMRLVSGVGQPDPGRRVQIYHCGASAPCKAVHGEVDLPCKI